MKKRLVSILFICIMVIGATTAVSADTFSPGRSDYSNVTDITYNFSTQSNMPHYKVWIQNTGNVTIQYTVYYMPDPYFGMTVTGGTLAPGEQIHYYDIGGGADYQVMVHAKDYGQRISFGINYRMATTRAELG